MINEEQIKKDIYSILGEFYLAIKNHNPINWDDITLNILESIKENISENMDEFEDIDEWEDWDENNMTDPELLRQAKSEYFKLSPILNKINKIEDNIAHLECRISDIEDTNKELNDEYIFTNKIRNLKEKNYSVGIISEKEMKIIELAEVMDKIKNIINDVVKKTE